MHPVISPRTTRARVAPKLLVAGAALAVPLALVLAFTWAPTATIELAGTDGGGEVADYAQKIFYLHVPVAFAAYLGFFVGAWNALLLIWKGDETYDLRSYVGVHVGMVFGTLVLVTGAIWAKAAWGVWWQWGDRQLLVFLVLYLFYGAYFMLRFSLEPGRQRSRVSAAFALTGLALVPLSFLAIRIADTLIHPIVIERGGLAMSAPMGWTFLISIAGFLSLALAMMQLELTAKLGTLRAAATGPAGPPAEAQRVAEVAQ